MKRSGSWAVKVVSRDPAGKPSSSLMDLGLGLNSGLSLMSRIRIETVAVDCRGRWMPRASATSFSASTVNMKERVSSKSMGWREEGWDEIIVTWYKSTRRTFSAIPTTAILIIMLIWLCRHYLHRYCAIITIMSLHEYESTYSIVTSHTYNSPLAFVHAEQKSFLVVMH